jgi:hypothetical protein
LEISLPDVTCGSVACAKDPGQCGTSRPGGSAPVTASMGSKEDNPPWASIPEEIGTLLW